VTVGVGNVFSYGVCGPNYHPTLFGVFSYLYPSYQPIDYKLIENCGLLPVLWHITSVFGVILGLDSALAVIEHFIICNSSFATGPVFRVTFSLFCVF
jgi:hypothetical protein